MTGPVKTGKVIAFLLFLAVLLFLAYQLFASAKQKFEEAKSNTEMRIERAIGKATE